MIFPGCLNQAVAPFFRSLNLFSFGTSRILTDEQLLQVSLVICDITLCDLILKTGT
jgi:hypothetical protein